MRNETLQAWLSLIVQHARPARIHWCDGSVSELAWLREQLQAEGALEAPDRDRYPGCFVHRSDPTDAVGLPHRRFVSTPNREDAGPTNHWLSEDDTYGLVWPLFAKAMVGRTLFVVPYLLGSPASKYAQVGVQLTDSPLVVLWMATLTQVGHVALEHLGRSGDFVRGVHCLSDLEPARRFQVLFPATQTCWSIGTACPEVAALFKSHALGLAGCLAPEEGYLAEHMSVFGITSPSHHVRYVAAAFPSGCGKTHLATLAPSIPGWTVELVADGACLLRVGDDGQLWAMNPAAGIDGLVGDVPPLQDPAGRGGLTRDVLFANVAFSAEGVRAAHPNARFVVPARHWPNLSKKFYAADGVPLSAILFGGRRSGLVPLVFEATSWEHGVYVGATTRSESASCGGGLAGAPRHDPMAMLPFCTYNLADYLGHWLRLGSLLQRPPRIFHVNWFRTGERGQLLWPGFGENIRVLDWALARVERAVDARRTPIGFVPRSLDTRGLELAPDALEQLLRVDVGGWLREARESEAFLGLFGERLPATLRRQHAALLERLREATN